MGHHRRCKFVHRGETAVWLFREGLVQRRCHIGGTIGTQLPYRGWLFEYVLVDDRVNRLVLERQSPGDHLKPDHG